jgi:hypothetical protein
VNKISSSSTKAAPCTIKGIPPKVTNFVCDVVSQACSRVVQPKTATVSVAGLDRVTTIVQTAGPICQTNTPLPATNIQTVTETLPPTTVTEIYTPSAIIATVAVTPEAITNIITITNPPRNQTVVATTTTTRTVSTTSTIRNSQCTPGVFSLTGSNQPPGSARTEVESFCNTQCVPAVGFEASSPTFFIGDFPACMRQCLNYSVGDAVYDKATARCTCNVFQGTRTSDVRYDCAKNRSMGTQVDKK